MDVRHNRGDDHGLSPGIASRHHLQSEEQLTTQHDTRIPYLTRRIESLQAALERSRSSAPERAMSWLGVALALSGLGYQLGFSSKWFLVPATIFALFSLSVVAKEWMLLKDIQDMRLALDAAESAESSTP